MQLVKTLTPSIFVDVMMDLAFIGPYLIYFMVLRLTGVSFFLGHFCMVCYILMIWLRYYHVYINWRFFYLYDISRWCFSSNTFTSFPKEKYICFERRCHGPFKNFRWTKEKDFRYPSLFYGFFNWLLILILIFCYFAFTWKKEIIW